MTSSFSYTPRSHVTTSTVEHYAIEVADLSLHISELEDEYVRTLNEIKTTLAQLPVPEREQIFLRVVEEYYCEYLTIEELETIYMRSDRQIYQWIANGRELIKSFSALQ